MAPMIVPRKVEPDPATRTLVVTWADGHESRIPYQRLRDHCPCARCRDERDKGVKALSMALTTKLDGWKRIGNYALNFSWGDSHGEGIYAYDYLRGLCPCGVCRLPERYTIV
jgi:DUF971 family protein